MKKIDSVKIIAVFPVCCIFYIINGKTLMIDKQGLIKKIGWMM
jgi:hypothetical protein